MSDLKVDFEVKVFSCKKGFDSFAADCFLFTILPGYPKP
jgi:hypothetical protein